MIYEEILLYHFPNFLTDYEDKKKKGISICTHIVNNANKDVEDPIDSDEYESDD